MVMFKNKTILITGGTGSFGNHFLKMLLKKYNSCKKIIIFSRDELKQSEMIKRFLSPKLRFFLGDIRDLNRLKIAFSDVDIVIHAAALKQVPTAEYNPFEFIKTNVVGTQNVVEACLSTNVKKLISLSTDKASSPINLYGATKLAADKLVLSLNNISGNRKIKSSVVRYGNVLGSRGSLLGLLMETSKKNYFNITDLNMTRFNITLKDACEMVFWSLQNMKGGEIFVPKIPSFKILDMARCVNNKARIKKIGLRPGEKIHEEMISKHELIYTYDLGKYYAVLNSKDTNLLKKYKSKKLATLKDSYNSKDNKDKMSQMDLRKVLDEYKNLA